MLPEQNELVMSPLSRLRWACRRGMLELDVLLTRFLDERFTCLNVSHKAYFAALLTYQDPEIFSWLMGHARPDDEGLAVITDAIRQHAQARIHA